MVSPEVLRRYPVFAGMDLPTLRALAVISEERHAAAGEVLFDAGAPATHLYVVTWGEVDITCPLADGRSQVVDTVVAGELLSWSALVPPHQTTAAAVTRTEAHLVAIEALAVRAMCEKDPLVGYRLMSYVAGVLRHRLDGALLQLAAMARHAEGHAAPS